MKMRMWEKNARVVEVVFGDFVDWDERFYRCPVCDRPIYEEHWSEDQLEIHLCPMCEFNGKGEK